MQTAKSNMPWTDTDVAELKRMRADGWTVKKCADVLGRTEGATFFKLRRLRLGIGPARDVDRSYRRATASEERTILLHFLLGDTQDIIGVQVNRSRQGVSRIQGRLVTNKARAVREKLKIMRRQGASDEAVKKAARAKLESLYAFARR